MIKQLPEIKFPSKPLIAHWLNWSLLEPEEGKINFQPLIDNIKLACQKGYGSIVRIHFSATGFTPDWMKQYNIPIRKETATKLRVTNY